MIKPANIDLLSPPFVAGMVLHIAPQTLISPSLRPRRRIDKASYATNNREHEQEANDTRGLLTLHSTK